jgi:hypothetical protein
MRQARTLAASTDIVFADDYAIDVLREGNVRIAYYRMGREVANIAIPKALYQKALRALLPAALDAEAEAAGAERAALFYELSVH